MKKTKKLPTKKTAVKRVQSAPSLAMHSASSPDWGTPPLLRSFGATVLRPAAVGPGIDLDYATSAYWQQWWDEDDRPQNFLDGSKSRDVLVAADRRRACPTGGTGFINWPGLGGGDMAQACWKLFEEDHREGHISSGYVVGYSVEQFGSLQNVGQRNPLTVAADDLITTIVPSRRAHYVLHPEQLIAITKRKQKKRARRSKQWIAEQRLLDRLRDRTEDRPVDAGAPSHLSYVSILWAADRDVRATQKHAARAFLKEQHENPKSLLFKFEVIGSL